MKIKSLKLKRDTGLSLVEVLIAVSIIIIFVVALVGVHNLYLNMGTSNSDTLKAVYLTEEGIEAMKFLRDSSWTTNIADLTNGTSYYLNFTGSNWQTSTTNTFIDSKFERKIVLTAVYRDTDGRITTSGGTVDSSTKLLTSTVSWSKKSATTTKSISTYITNLYDN